MMGTGFLPSSARTTLRTTGKIDEEGMRDLLMPGVDMPYEAIYPIAKAYDAIPGVQLQFFQGLYEAVCAQGDALTKYLESVISLFPPLPVDAAQLVQFSHHGGFDVWRREWHNQAVRFVYRQATPILIAYASLAGLPYFLRGLANVCVVVSGWIDKQDMPYCGYEFSRGSYDAGRSLDVRLIPKGERFPESPVHLVDDTMARGDTLAKIQRYLAGCGNYTICPSVICPGNSNRFPADGETIVRWQAA